jgi:HPt (histidine-containing phosphotransfer) domain-containing protein
MLVKTVGDATEIGALLRQFAEAIRDDAQTIAQAMEQGDAAEAGRLIHRLKGASGNLRAMNLYAAAVRLESDLQAGQDPAPALDALCRAHVQALAAIADLPTAPAAAQAAPDAADPAALKHLVAEIQAQLNQGMRIPRSLLLDLEAALPARDRPLYLDLKRHLDRFDYRAADAILEQLLCSPSGPET